MFEGQVYLVVAPAAPLLVPFDNVASLILGHSFRVGPVAVNVVVVCTADTHNHAGQITSRTEHTVLVEGFLV